MIRNFGNVTGLTAQPMGLDTGVGINTDDATATAGDLLSGKIAYAKGKRIIGTMGLIMPGTDQIRARFIPVTSSSLIYQRIDGPFTFKIGGTYRIVFNLGTLRNGTTVFGRIFRNNEPYGTERSVTNNGSDFSENLFFESNDTFDLRIRTTDQTVNAQSNSFSVFISFASIIS
jgi:hypothetical protein